MPEPTATDSPTTVPPWLADAVEAYERQKSNERADAIMLATRQADQINGTLANFGAEPLQPARADQTGRLVGALLVGADQELGTYEVRAFWDERSRQIELHTTDRDAVPAKSGRVRLMNDLSDIAAARHEIPKAPPPRRNFKAEALNAIDALDVDRLNNHEVEAVTEAINGLTSAVLHVGELITRAYDRP